MRGHPMTQLSMDALREMMPKGQALGQAIEAGKQQGDAFDRSLDDMSAARLKGLEVDLSVSEDEVKKLTARLDKAEKEHWRLKVQVCGLRQYLHPEQFSDH